MTLPTRPIRIPSSLRPKTTWGSTTVNANAQINLYFEHVAKPTRIKLTHPTILGRTTPGNFLKTDVDLTSYGAAEKGVSRQHVVIEVIKERVMITDPGSKNGTYLNGCRLSPHHAYIMRDGDEIRLGNLIGKIYF